MRSIENMPGIIIDCHDIRTYADDTIIIVTVWKIQFRRKSLCNKSMMSFEVSKRVLTCYIEPVLIYGCQTWVIGKLANKIPEPQKCQFTEDCGELHHHLHHHHHEVSCRLVWLVQILLSPTSLLSQIVI